MTNGCKVKTISPMLAVPDMDGAIGFYKDVLGFTTLMQSPAYSIV